MSGSSGTQGAMSTQAGPAAKVTQCPMGHPLKRLNIGYVPGSCDGCNTRMKPKDSVMDCRKCNWYLCQWCCPLRDQAEAPERILTRLTSKAAQELTDLREATLAGCSCGAAAKAKRASDAGEITVPVHAEASNAGAAESGLRREHSAARSSPRTGTPAAAAAAAPLEPAAEEEAEAEEEAMPAAPPAPMEDLIDVGQHDLLDLDAELSPAGKVEEKGTAQQQFDKLGREEEDGLSKGLRAIQAGA